mmetsp:Transcript_20715/g.52213  ORF Transcript_20715/g.52213 Transcript_20715/m.52213 type:complete len:204 (+) Transcript_20715:1188-1799(+)
MRAAPQHEHQQPQGTQAVCGVVAVRIVDSGGDASPAAHRKEQPRPRGDHLAGGSAPAGQPPAHRARDAQHTLHAEAGPAAGRRRGRSAHGAASVACRKFGCGGGCRSREVVVVAVVQRGDDYPFNTGIIVRPGFDRIRNRTRIRLGVIIDGLLCARGGAGLAQVSALVGTGQEQAGRRCRSQGGGIARRWRSVPMRVALGCCL